jgi:hypothetical protein
VRQTGISREEAKKAKKFSDDQLSNILVDEIALELADKFA